jgi:twinkle protein
MRDLQEVGLRGWPTRAATSPTTERDGELVAQKLRKAGKKFSSIGPERKNKPLYGMWLWPRRAGRIVVTEGEIDALSMSRRSTTSGRS